MDQVAIFVDTQNLGSYGCEQGLNGNLVITPYVTPGQHTVQLVTYNSQENATAFAQSDALHGISWASRRKKSRIAPISGMGTMRS